MKTLVTTALLVLVLSSTALALSTPPPPLLPGNPPQAPIDGGLGLLALGGGAYAIRKLRAKASN